MSKKTRRHHTPDQKINLLRRHHLEKVPVSEVCEGAELQPSVFYHWQRHLFEHGAAAFGESRKRAETSREQDLLAEIDRHSVKPTKKGTGFVQPLDPHMHWHVDLAVITIAGIYYYLCSVLDGYSRAVVAWDFADRMTEADVELILQRALEAHPGARPRVISDNGPQFIAGDNPPTCLVHAEPIQCSASVATPCSAGAGPATRGSRSGGRATSRHCATASSRAPATWSRSRGRRASRWHPATARHPVNHMSSGSIG